MKGPGGRLKFDIRRLWECPACHRRELTAGDVVTRLCACSAKSEPPRQNWMKLIEQKPAKPAPLPPPPSAPVETVTQVVEVPPQSPQIVTPALPTNDTPTPPGS